MHVHTYSSSFILKMGNCIGTAFAFPHNDNKVSPNEEDLSKASTLVAGKIRSGPCNDSKTGSVSELCNGPLPLAALLKHGEVCRPFQMIEQHSFQVNDNCIGQRVKIVVSKKQLQLLLRSVEELKSRHIVIQSIGRRGKKWRPTLAAIPEL